MQTKRTNEIAVGAYNGLFFIRMDKTNFDELSTFVLDDEKYLQGEFVNKVLEYSKDMLICTIWDTKKY